MSTLYWITRLDVILLIDSIIFIFTGLLTALTWAIEDDDDEHFFRKYKKKLFIILAISAITVTFIPTTNDAYIIYGVGGTIDYLKQNKDAKKLPDKTIKALNIFLDNEIKKDSINK